MEKDKIKDLFSSKLSGFEADVPASVWGGLDLLLSQQPLPAADPTSSASSSSTSASGASSSSTIGTSVIKGALIAAGVSVAVVSGILLYPDKETNPIAHEKVAIVPEQEPVIEIEPVSVDTLSKVSIRPYNAIKVAEIAKVDEEELPLVISVIQPPSIEETSVPTQDTVAFVESSSPVIERVEVRAAEIKGISLNLFVSKGLSSYNKIQNGPEILFSYEDRGSVFKQALKDENSEYTLRHKQPLSIGLTISKGLSKRLSIETGVIYTYLQSDITSASIFDIQEKQALHYLGIPVSLNYNFYNLGKADLYLAIGAMIQKDFSGEYESNMGFTRLNFEDRKLAHQIYYGEPYFIREHIKQSNPQISTHLKLGIAYPIYKKLYLYGTFGGTYYFDARNKYPTIYSDKKLQMNIDLGIKFDF